MELSDKEKFDTSDTKIILKKIAGKYLPDEIVHRKKCGFGLPISDWLKDSAGLGKYLNFFVKPSINRSYLNYDFIVEMINEHLSDKKNNSEILWILITLEIWVRIFIDNEGPQNIWKML